MSAGERGSSLNPGKPPWKIQVAEFLASASKG
jgi:hypothetical protein